MNAYKYKKTQELYFIDHGPNLFAEKLKNPTDKDFKMMGTLFTVYLEQQPVGRLSRSHTAST